MNIRCLGALALTLTFAAVSLSCGKKDPEATKKSPTAATRPPLAPGISKNLTRNPEAPFYNFDSLGPVNYPATQKNIQLQSDSEIVISGWALDASKNSTAGAVDVVIDGVPYAAQYGTERRDVAEHYKRPDYAKSGFQLLLKSGQFTKGPHALAIRVIAADRKSYNEGPVVPFSVN
jgi:hypothetical protein